MSFFRGVSARHIDSVPMLQIAQRTTMGTQLGQLASGGVSGRPR